METKRTSVSTATLNRWQLFLFLSVTGIVIFFSSVYFLYFSVGFQGGHNPDYGAIIVFNREIWDVIHLWSGIGMIIVLILHIGVHDKWIFAMIKRVFQGEIWRNQTLEQACSIKYYSGRSCHFEFLGCGFVRSCFDALTKW